MITISDNMFYEIEYDSSPIPGVGRFVQKPQSQKITQPKKDEKRDLFTQMRDIARAHRSTYDFSNFYNRRTQSDNAMIFYKQAIFMKDFSDDYPIEKPFSQYFPYYQMLGYEQLRTYFTWRTKVRDGVISNTSLSYAFLYLYELLCNIGVETPQDGLDKLIFFWKSFSEHNKSINKYVLRWLKDYHIYYQLPHTFKEFTDKNGLAEHYPKLTHADNDFELYSAISKYDIKKSKFFTDDNLQMITECFTYTLDKIRYDFESGGIRFDDALFRPTRKLITWKPFKDALFHNPNKQPDRKVLLSENEIYICKKGEWKFSTVITTEKGRQFIGYVIKQMEATLRQVTKYKYKLTANTNMINEDTIRVLTKAGIFIEKIVPAAVLDYHREATKIIVTVDHASLARIREQALRTQEALIVEEEHGDVSADISASSSVSLVPTASVAAEFTELNQNVFADTADSADSSKSEQDAALNIWENLKDSFDDNELQALSIILQGGNLKTFADKCNIMLEVLVDGINEKSMDYIGDNIIDSDDDFAIYGDYSEQVRKMSK